MDVRHQRRGLFDLIAYLIFDEVLLILHLFAQINYTKILLSFITERCVLKMLQQRESAENFIKR